LKKEKAQGTKTTPAAKQPPVEKQQENKTVDQAQEVNRSEQERTGPAQAKIAGKSLDSSSTVVQGAQKAASVPDEVASLQKLLMAKEKEIGKHIKHIDKQMASADNLAKENEQLREQLKLSSEGD